MKTKQHRELDPVVRRFIEDAGSMTQSFGVGRVLGQIYAYLYFSPEPRNLGNMQEALGISKGSASTGVRQLEQWGAVRKIWIKGDRKDYYEANDWLGRIVRNVMQDTVGSKLASYASLLDEMQEELQRNTDGDSETEFVREQIEKLRRFQQKAHKAWHSPLVRMFLK